jgi:hypothetical protein
MSPSVAEEAQDRRSGRPLAWWSGDEGAGLLVLMAVVGAVVPGTEYWLAKSADVRFD